MKKPLVLGLCAVAVLAVALVIYLPVFHPVDPVVGESRGVEEGTREESVLVADPRVETPEPVQQSVATDHQPVHALPRGEYGYNKTLEDVYVEISTMILVWVPDEAEFHRRNLGWKVDDEKWSTTLPFGLLAEEDFQLDAESMQAAMSVASDYEERLRQASATAWDLLHYYADYYARHHAEKRPLSKDGSLSRRVVWEGPPENDPRYSTQFGVPAGKWQFEVYFMSTDFPDLQEALIEIEDIKSDRDEAIKLVLR